MLLSELDFYNITLCIDMREQLKEVYYPEAVMYLSLCMNIYSKLIINLYL